MTIVAPKPGGWTHAVTVVDANDLNLLQQELVKAPDFAAGGTYNPTATVNVGGQGITCTGTTQLKLASRSIVRMQPFVVQAFGLTNWSVLASYLNSDAFDAAEQPLVELPRLIDGATLTAVTMRIDPAGAHGGDVVPPAFDVGYLNQDGSYTSLGVSTDPTGGVIGAGYEAAHSITKTGIAHVIDLTQYRYGMVISCEGFPAGANYVANCKFRQPTATMTVTAQSEG